jgi:hypothetical protein
MTDHHGRRAPRRGRARKRAIRAQAARAGVAYSVAARQLEAAGLRPGETIASDGRTLYPVREFREARERRPFEQRRADTRLAGAIPAGRAAHLVERFPPLGRLYQGAGRVELLSRLYLAVADRSPGLVPAIGDLAWTAEMGEETAVDMICAALDREVRELLDQGSTATALDGVRQILDALLVVANDGHAPGTQVRMLTSPHENSAATVVGAVWGAPGPPVAYRVRVEGLDTTVAVTPGELVVLAGQ